MVIYRGAVRVEARDPRVMDPALFGFDLQSFLPTVWELVPYSFLIDYFSNISDVVLGWSHLFTKLAWSNRTVRQWIEVTSRSYDHPGWQGYAPYSATYVPATFVGTKTSVSRRAYSGTFVPEVTLKVPSLGSLRWLNIAALVASRKSDRSWRYD
jgi:hypothetical protein